MDGFKAAQGKGPPCRSAAVVGSGQLNQRLPTRTYWCAPLQTLAAVDSTHSRQRAAHAKHYIPHTWGGSHGLHGGHTVMSLLTRRRPPAPAGPGHAARHRGRRQRSSCRTRRHRSGWTRCSACPGARHQAPAQAGKVAGVVYSRGLAPGRCVGPSKRAAGTICGQIRSGL